MEIKLYRTKTSSINKPWLKQLSCNTDNGLQLQVSTKLMVRKFCSYSFADSLIENSLKENISGFSTWQLKAIIITFLHLPKNNKIKNLVLLIF